MRFHRVVIIVCVLAFSVIAVAGHDQPDAPPTRERIISIPATPQRDGDADAGRRYVLHGDYLGSGYPYNFYILLSLGSMAPEQTLQRADVDRRIPPSYNVFESSNGVRVVGGLNCLGCHASMFNGELVIGLGNSMMDWSVNEDIPADELRTLVGQQYGDPSPEREAFEQFIRGVEVLYPTVVMPFVGVNPAFTIEEVAAAHRRPDDLTWSTEPLYTVGENQVASDVPPWWHMRKKNALYYNGMGRGDFSKLIGQINVVAIRDADDAQRTNDNMDDVVAFMRALEPPSYPGDIDQLLAERGRGVFETNCTRCHGTYGEIETYPNKLVPISEVGTDPAYAEMLMSSELPTWYNRSWYAQTEPASRVEPSMAYIAPPLDGIWCTAPYFHNGSVPTLDAVIDSSIRPTFWERSFRDDDYDLDRIGWRFKSHDAGGTPRVYDTTVDGYRNTGHTYGDDLTDTERRALLEYLKTL
ncbi:MAG: hypothetical protein AAF432_14440 [Planctomycetota bacterium]